MKKVLIETASGRLCDIVLPGAEFPVSTGLQWADAPDDVAPDTHEFNGTAVVVKAPLPPVIPSRVTMRQARLALLGAGMLPAVDAAVAGIPGAEGEAARIEWEYALSVDRNSPLVASLAVALALTPAQLDALFTAGAGL